MSVEAFGWAWDQRNISCEEKMTLLVLADCHQPGVSRVRCPIKHVEEVAGLARGIVSACLETLEARELIMAEDGYYILALPVSPPKPARAVVAAWVYVMRSGTGLTKIGISKDVFRRLTGMRTAFPGGDVHLVHTFAGDMKQVRQWETLALVTFASKRVNGEWIDVEPDMIVSFLKGLTKSEGVPA
jgi:hypothetical protein